MASPPVLLGPAEITLLALNSIRDGLEQDFTAACLKWAISKHVGDVILSLTYEQIVSIARSTTVAHLLRLANGNNLSYWLDLRRSLDNGDAAGVEMSLISSLRFLPQEA